MHPAVPPLSGPAANLPSDSNLHSDSAFKAPSAQEDVNSALFEYLLLQESRDALESLLADSLQRFLGLYYEIRSGSLDMGDIPDERELVTILGDVSSRVNDFLSVSVTDLPGITYYSVSDMRIPENLPIVSLYAKAFVSFAASVAAAAVSASSSFPELLAPVPYLAAKSSEWFSIASSERRAMNDSFYYSSSSGLSGGKFGPPLIVVPREHYASVVPAVAHEYAHSVFEDFSSLDSDIFRAVEEGFARGVERFVSKSFFKESGNTAFLYDISRFDFVEFLLIYLNSSAMLSRKVPFSLVKDISQAYNLGVLSDVLPLPLEDILSSDYVPVQSELLYAYIGSCASWDKVSHSLAGSGLYFDPHPLGNSYFALKSLQEGDDVYFWILEDPQAVLGFPIDEPL